MSQLHHLDFATLRVINVARCLKWQPNGLHEWSLSDWGVAAAGEMGEALNIIKKLNRDRDGLVGNALSHGELHSELADEIADVLIYLDLLAASEGIDLAKAVITKFNKTSAKRGFPDQLVSAVSTREE